MKNFILHRKYPHFTVNCSNDLYKKNRFCFARALKEKLYDKPVKYFGKNQHQIFSILLLLTVPYYSITRALNNNLFIDEPNSFWHEIKYFQIIAIISRFIIIFIISNFGILNHIINLADFLFGSDENSFNTYKILFLFLFFLLLFDLPEIIQYTMYILLNIFNRNNIDNVSYKLNTDVTNCDVTKNLMGKSRLMGVIMEVCTSFYIGQANGRAIISLLFSIIFWYMLFILICAIVIVDKTIYHKPQEINISDRNGNNKLILESENMYSPNVLLTM